GGVICGFPAARPAFTPEPFGLAAPACAPAVAVAAAARPGGAGCFGEDAAGAAAAAGTAGFCVTATAPAGAAVSGLIVPGCGVWSSSIEPSPVRSFLKSLAYLSSAPRMSFQVLTNW